jgi:SHS2 domain-containing protein
MGGKDNPHEGVRLLDHTADVGIEVTAPDLASLACRAALGMDWLLREAPAPIQIEERPFRVTGEDPAMLVRALLRELLHWHERDGFAPVWVRVEEASDAELRGTVPGGFPGGTPVREIKGVTLHGLRAECRGDGWWGRIIFDV